MSIVIYLCINMRKERFQVRISSNGFSETFFSLFNFHFSVCIGPSANTLFNFQFSLFNFMCFLGNPFFQFSICSGLLVNPLFHFSICIAPSANTLFNFQLSLFNLYWFLGEHSFQFSTLSFSSIYFVGSL